MFILVILWYNSNESIKKIIPVDIKKAKNINKNNYDTINLDLLIVTKFFLLINNNNERY